MEEIWKEIPGFDGAYQVSSLGNVRSCDRIIYYRNGNPRGSCKHEKGRIISQHISNSGYYNVPLRKNKIRKFYFVHRLVAQTFLDNPENKPQVNHIDGNRLNNQVSNLEWATRSENVNHALRTGLLHGLRGDLSPHKVAVLQYEKDGTFVREWSCMADAARFLNGTKAGIYSACRQKNCKTYKGYIWKYAGA